MLLNIAIWWLNFFFDNMSKNAGFLPFLQTFWSINYSGNNINVGAKAIFGVFEG
jgi:hypothetical protein